MDKVRVSEVAKELGVKSKDVIEKAAELGISIKTASSNISVEQAEILANFILTGEKPQNTQAKKTASKKTETSSQTKASQASSKSKKVSPVKEEVKKDAPKAPAKEKQSDKIRSAKEVKAQVQKELKEEKETLAGTSLKKRRGLVIVKKRHNAPENIEEKEEESTSLKTLEAMFSNSTDAKKKKKIKKSSPAAKKTDSEKLDLLGNGDFADISFDSEDEMVVLPDLTIKTKTLSTKTGLKSKINTNQSYQLVQNNFFQQEGIQRRSRKKRKKSVDKTDSELVTSIDIPAEIRVYEFAEKIGKQSSEIISKLFLLGVMVTKNDFLDADAIEILSDEFEIDVNITDVQEGFDYIKEYEETKDNQDKLITRAPVVTIMGHVDHGKTSLLDFIRSSRVASQESGGITQHVGAYMVEKNNKNITFIDTPGHEAFSHMRARGAKITDIVIIVVAADDGVKPQTIEAIDHAKAAGVPIIVAVNKIDKPAANPDMVKTQLSEIGILPTDWGGEHEFVHVSAKSGEGIEDLLELILLQAEVLELKADPTRDAKATVVESSLEKGRGAVATVIVENGTLRVGNTIVAGVAYGKIRALLDDQGNNLEAIAPGEPGVIVGLSEIPEAGETVMKVQNDKEARDFAKQRYDYLRQKELSKTTKVSLDELSDKIIEGEIKSLPIVLKADTQGSLEAIKGSLDKLKNEETKANIVHSGVGGVSESDVHLANSIEDCIILGFNIRPTGSVREKAKKAGVTVRTYKVIYDLIDDVKAILSGMMKPILREEHLGQAKVREVFNIPKIGTIAGCIVTSGSINRGAKVRLIRDGIIVYEGTISSLKRFKDDVKEVANGYECGIGIENFDNIQIDDYIESFKEVEEKVTL